MGALFASQRDYLYFCAGALFVILAVTAGTAQRRQRDKIPWLWLTLFANISAAGKWMNLVWLSMGDTPLFSSVRQVTVSAAFVCLLVFADRTLAATGVVRRWQRIVLLCGGCLVLGFGVWIFHGGNGVRWMLCVSSTAWAAVALWLVARRATHGRHALLLVSYAMAGFCVCTACGIFQENLAPVLTVAHHDIFSRVGLVIKSCDIACIAAMILGMALYCKEPATAAHAMPLASCPGRALMRLALVLLLVVGAGWFLTARAGHYAHTLQARSLLSRAELAANAWEGGLAEQLTGSAADNTNPVYHLMKRRLMRMRMVAPDVRFIYLMSRHGTSIVFNVDSEPATSVDCSPAGQVYTEASPEIYRAFSARTAFVGGPLQDRWGTWVSAYTPLPATSSAAAMMILGMDVEVTEWRRALAVYRLVPISITALVILLLVGFFTNREQMRQATQHRLHELRLVLDNLPGSAFMKDCQGRYLMANRSFCEAMGQPLHAILGQTDFVLLPDTAEMFTREDQQVIATGQPLLIGGADLLEAGNAATVTTRKVPLRNEHGDVVGIVGLTFDMREHKRAMTALRESEEKHRILLACIQSPVLALNRDEIILYCNDAYTQAVNTPA
ncbi:MAG: PAS domain-containing protein, partial [bacterium]|nr:PAS domain-containing protein [bacterium]